MVENSIVYHCYKGRHATNRGAPEFLSPQEYMELTQLRYFVEAAEILHFTKASKRLHISQSALSYNIRQLEQELETLLFERSGASVALTSAGELLLIHAKRVLREATLAHRALRDAISPSERVLRIGVTPTFGPELVPSLIESYRDQHPRTRLVIEKATGSSIVETLRQGTIDLGIGYFQDAPEHTEVIDLFETDLVAVMLPEHPWSSFPHLRWSQFEARSVILTTSGCLTRFTD